MHKIQSIYHLQFCQGQEYQKSKSFKIETKNASMWNGWFIEEKKKGTWSSRVAPGPYIAHQTKINLYFPASRLQLFSYYQGKMSPILVALQLSLPN